MLATEEPSPITQPRGTRGLSSTHLLVVFVEAAGRGNHNVRSRPENADLFLDRHASHDGRHTEAFGPKGLHAVHIYQASRHTVIVTHTSCYLISVRAKNRALSIKHDKRSAWTYALI